MDWEFVLIVLGIYSIVGFVAGLASGHIEGGAGLIGGGCALIVGAVPLALLAMLVLWLTGNDRLWTGIAVGLFGWYALGKTLRDMNSKNGSMQ